MGKTCNCDICVRSRKWESTEDKTSLFTEMCNVIINAEFEEQCAKHESSMMREYMQEFNILEDYIKWRRS